MNRIIFLVCMSYCFIARAQGEFTNPILQGGYPDPSIVRVEEDFYIVNSSFEYFPALPIHHSTDLVNWELIGHGINRKEQLGEVNLIDVQQQGGIHAPSIRYNKGIFYIVVTNVYSPKDNSLPAEMVNFVLTAKDPKGPWSKPHIIEGAPGIDPDLFFDDDGKVYFVGTHDTGQPTVNGIGEIWVQELDLNDWKLIGPRSSIWRGACGGCCVEGPHIYKKNGLYYLMVAEGGTSRNHAVMIANSDDIRGPYTSNPKNPILTSRHLSNNNWVHSTGHADLVELDDGRWYMVALGVRNVVDGTTNMGRETHLIPVQWETAVSGWKEEPKGVWKPIEDYWPVCAPLSGKVERKEVLPFTHKPQIDASSFRDDFEDKTLNPQWNFRRAPLPDMYSLNARKGFLRLKLSPKTFELREQYHAMGFRQTESDFSYTVQLNFEATTNNAQAGISIFQQDDNYLNYNVLQQDGEPYLILERWGNKTKPNLIYKQKLDGYTGQIILNVTSKENQYSYRFSLDQGMTFSNLGKTEANLVLCKGYIGTQIGLYASSNGQKTKEYADFDWINFQGTKSIN